MSQILHFDTQKTVYNLEKGGKLFVVNSTFCYEPFRDYDYKNVPKSAVKTEESPKRDGYEDGGSSYIKDIFTFTEPGTFKMIVNHLGHSYKGPITPYEIQIIVNSTNNEQEILQQNKKKECTLL